MNGVVTAHRVDHATQPPTEHTTVEYAKPPLLPTVYPLVDQIGRTVGYANTPGLHEYMPPIGEAPDFKILDHPYIGGRFSVFCLLWGDHFELAQRCIGSIIDNSPTSRIDLRVGANQVCAQTREWLLRFPKEIISKIYFDDGDANDQKSRKKYPCMREMFWDKSHPISTPYVLWFDDDSHVVDRFWMVKLADEIVKNHGHGVRMYGAKMFHDLAPYIRKGFRPEKWFRAASWWKGQPLYLDMGKRIGPNGSLVPFVSGGFWALATEAIRMGDIPDRRLNHNGGDCTVGAQVHQAGFRIKDFSRKKEVVKWSDAKRRGYHEKFPWSEIK